MVMPASEGLKAQAFEAGADPALVIGGDGALKAANEAAESLFGQGLGLLSRSRFRDAVTAGDKVDRLMARALDNKAASAISPKAMRRASAGTGAIASRCR